MERWKSLADIPEGFGPSVIALGNFDGVHRGHQRVLQSIKEAAERKSARSVAITYFPHPASVLNPQRAPLLITDLERRLDLIEQSGINATLVQEFTRELSQQSAEYYVKRVFVDALNISDIYAGKDIHFGRNGEGNLNTLIALAGLHGFDVHVVENVTAQAEGVAAEGSEKDSVHDHSERRWSSSYVRELLSRGLVDRAAQVLGRDHSVRGKVVHGAARGRELGFPTANLDRQISGYIPADGVYAGWLIDSANNRWPAAVSVGSNVTFNETNRQVEAHVIDRPDEHIADFDLYGQVVTIEFKDRIRSMVAFNSVEELVEQMATDVDETRQLLAEGA